jgi:hypothetical protein
VIKLKYLYYLLAIIVFSVSACTKKEYSIKVDGHIYNSCNLDPVENVQVRLYNVADKNFGEKYVQTDANGYFDIELKGEGTSELRIDIQGVYLGPITSCTMNIIKNDTSFIELSNQNLNITDTLYVSVYPVDLYNSIFFSNVVYKFTLSDFQSNKTWLKISRNDLMNFSFNKTAAMNKLWVSNNLDANLVWGIGVDDFNRNKEKLIQKTFISTDRIKLIYLKNCDNSNKINIY